MQSDLHVSYIFFTKAKEQDKRTREPPSKGSNTQSSKVVKELLGMSVFGASTAGTLGGGTPSTRPAAAASD